MRHAQTHLNLTSLSLSYPQPLTAYRVLLQAAVTSTRTHFSDFKRAHSKDSRFREFGKTEGEKEKVFKGWLRELGERKRAEASKAEERFREMLQGDKTIKEGDKWVEVSRVLSHGGGGRGGKGRRELMGLLCAG